MATEWSERRAGDVVIVDIVRESATARAIEPVVWLCVGLAAVPSVALWTAVAERLGIARAFALACLVEAVGVGASALTDGPASLVLAAVLLGGTFMGITALGLMGARRIARGDPRRLLAVMTASFGAGSPASEPRGLHPPYSWNPAPAS